MTHKYNVGDTVWVAGQSGYITPFQMTITDIHISDKGVYYDGHEMSYRIKEKTLNKSEKLLYLTREDCIKFMHKRTLDDCLQKREELLHQLIDLDNNIKHYEDLINESKN